MKKGLTSYLGEKGEQIVYKLLDAKNYEIIETNYRKRCGEIDLIAKDLDYYVFIEVKLRRSLKYGLPKEAVDISKQKKIINTALFYIAENDIFDKDIRFDVIEIYASDSYRIEHIENAFFMG